MSGGLKNVCRTAALPGASRNSAARTASTTMVLAVDSAAPRAWPWPPPPNSREPRRLRSSGDSVTAPTLRRDGRDGQEILQVPLLQAVQRAVALEARDGLVDA